MNSMNSLYAEQSMYAKLVVRKKVSTWNTYQIATTSNKSIFTYYTGSPVTKVDPKDYSITNLPDTIAKIPQQSIFKFINRIQDTNPDFRFVKIAPSPRSVFLDEPMVISDKKVSEFAFTPTEIAPNGKIFSNTYNEFKDLFKTNSETENAGNDDTTSSNATNTILLNPNGEDPEKIEDVRFSWLPDQAEDYPDLLNVLIPKLLVVFSTPERTDTHHSTPLVEALYEQFGLTQDQLNSSKNTTTTTIRILNNLARHFNRSRNYYTAQELQTAQTIINSYVQELANRKS